MGVCLLLLFGDSGVACALTTAPGAGLPTELELFGFEDGLQEWTIPAWEETAPDYAGRRLDISREMMSHGAAALQLFVDFTGERWTGAYVEREMYITDWHPFCILAVDVYLPPEAPEGLQARIILTRGAQWQWTEQNHTVPLAPGEWTTVRVNLASDSLDWTFFLDDTFRRDIRKIGLRIEAERGTVYRGPVLLDDIRLIR